MIRIGLIGAAWITPMAIIKPASKLDNVMVCAIAARDPERAKKYAKQHNIPFVEDSYASVLARPDIELIYIALPVCLHKEWASKALRAGKHVLCEKPLVMNVSEAQSLAGISAETDRYCIEAFHYRHHPYFKRILEIVQSGELGTIQKITGQLSVPVPPKPGQIRHSKEMGGGALMDLGCYPINMILALVGDAPKITKAQAIFGKGGVDIDIKADMEFPNGVLAKIECSMPEVGELSGDLVLEGRLGQLTARNPILPHLGGTLTIETKTAKRTEPTDTRTTFSYQLEAITQIISGNSPPMPSIENSIANAKVMDAIRSKII